MRSGFRGELCMSVLCPDPWQRGAAAWTQLQVPLTLLTFQGREGDDVMHPSVLLWARLSAGAFIPYWIGADSGYLTALSIYRDRR